MDVRRSFAAAHTKYHSFHDIELQEPPSPPRSRRGTGAETGAGGPEASYHGPTMAVVTASRRDTSPDDHLDDRQRLPSALKMQRHDSGYASRRTSDASSDTPPPSTSRISRMSQSSQIEMSRLDLSPKSGSQHQTCQPAPRTRPSTRRSAKSYPQPTPLSLHAGSGTSTGADTGTHASPAVYFQFPTPQLVEPIETTPPPSRHHLLLGNNAPRHSHHNYHQQSQQPPSPPIDLFPPPATTHYWTSDSTRRLEYAAIDAASRGVKGWVRRHLVPDCFTTRHVGFDDDSGSVRRYRLELLDENESPERQRQRQRLRQQQQQEQHQQEQRRHLFLAFNSIETMYRE
ncbi:hypothetical protein E4U21_006671 [Claviceps maximensis]|nr:hypothetical protein E4U21_006671 [Claviceps maximensis]